MDNGYRIEEGRVFWASSEVKNVHLASFVVLNTTWAKDRKYVYSAGSRIKGANPEVFVVLNRIFARDRDRIYFFYGHAKKIAHPQSFEVLDDGILDVDEVDPLMGYARDKEFVYFYEETFGAPRPLRGVNPSTFEVLPYAYGADHQRVYHRGFRLKPVDRASFEVLGPTHARDKKRVFYGEQAIPGADPATFEVVEGLCGKDAARVYLWTDPIEGADPESFETIDGEFLARDHEAVYADGKRLSGVAPDEFESLGRGYYRHDRAVYYRGELLPDADVDTFTVLPHLEPADKRAYWRGELQVPEEAVSGHTAMDARHTYTTSYSKPRKP